MASASASSSCSPQTPNIPLRRLVSRNSIFKHRTPSLFSTQSNTTTLPGYSSIPLPSYDSASINTEASLLPSPTSIQNFNPTSALQIQTQGKPAVSFPLAPKELEIPIFDFENRDGSEGPKYLSVRAKRRSGSCVLMYGGAQVASTTYAWGPGRNPAIRVGRMSVPIEDVDGDIMEGLDEEEVDEFEMQGKSLLTRTITFTSSKWGTFEWRYAGRRERTLADPSGKKSIHNLLVLEKVMGKGDKEQKIKVAQLIRSEETRTPGTRRTCAGNGGKLEMCLTGGGMEEGILVDERTVITTVLVMLKKEIDRLRAMQIAAMSAGGGGC